MSFNSHCVAMLKPPESLCAKDEGVTLRKRMGHSLPPRVSAGWSGHAAIAPPPLAPSVATSGPKTGLNPGPKWNSFSGPKSGTRMEQLFGARIRDPNGTAFRGPNRGPNQTTFRGPNPGPERNSFSGPESGPESNNFSGPESGTRKEQLFGARIGARIEQLFVARALGCGCFWGLFGGHRSAHLCPPAIFSGLEWYTTFRGPNPGPEWNSFSGPESGPESNNFSGPGALGCGCFSRDSLDATVSICTFVSTSHLFGARMVYDFSGPESGTRIRDSNGTAFRGPNPGPESNDFSARNSWLWIMFFQGLFGGHRFNLFWGPSPVPEW